MDAADSGSNNEIIAQRHVCVHGPLDYAALEPGASAIYVASQKEAFFAQDTTRPITPPLERALSKSSVWQDFYYYFALQLSAYWADALFIYFLRLFVKFNFSLLKETSSPVTFLPLIV